MNTPVYNQAKQQARRRAISEQEEKARAADFRRGLRLSTLKRLLHAIGIDGAEPETEQYTFDNVTYTLREDWQALNASVRYPGRTYRSRLPIRTKEQLGAFLLTLPEGPPAREEYPADDADAFYQDPVSSTLMYH